MTKNPRDHREWTNKELEEDSAGYLEAQQAYREDQAAAAQKKRDEDDRERFTEKFVASGGMRSDAGAAWKGHRNEEAARAARAADAVARQHGMRHANRVL